MDADPKVSELYEFILVKLPDAPAAKRARLCKALASIIGDEGLARALHSEADLLEHAESTHHQLALDFKRRAEG